MNKRNEEFIETSDGVKLHTIIKKNSSPVWIIVLHGIGEHSGRHQYIHDLFSKEYNIFQYDLRGHGKSSGVRGQVDKFDDYLGDLDFLLNNLREKQQMKRFILFGHSMGALIVATYIQKWAKKSFYPEKVFLSAPPVGLPGPLGKLVGLMPDKFVELITAMPSMKLGGLVDLHYLSHHSKTYEDYMNDELNIIKLHTRLLFGLIKTSREVFGRPLRPKCPAYCAVGTGDRIIDPVSLAKYFTSVEKDFELKVFQDAYHEMHNEIKQYRGPYLEYLRDRLTMNP